MFKGNNFRKEVRNAQPFQQRLCRASSVGIHKMPGACVSQAFQGLERAGNQRNLSQTVMADFPLASRQLGRVPAAPAGQLPQIGGYSPELNGLHDIIIGILGPHSRTTATRLDTMIP